jgi:hypothetical protein
LVVTQRTVDVWGSHYGLLQVFFTVED